MCVCVCVYVYKAHLRDEEGTKADVKKGRRRRRRKAEKLLLRVVGVVSIVFGCISGLCVCVCGGCEEEK